MKHMFTTDDRTIFTVTTVHYRGAPYGPSPRTVGWFSTHDEAVACVQKNEGDINETVYTYAVVEEIAAGLYPMLINQDWFEWTDDGYQPCETPVDGGYCYPFMPANFARQVQIG